jgi:hypothetical protein
VFALHLRELRVAQIKGQSIQPKCGGKGNNNGYRERTTPVQRNGEEVTLGIQFNFTGNCQDIADQPQDTQTMDGWWRTGSAFRVQMNRLCAS